MLTPVRCYGDVIVQKFFRPIHPFNPIVRLRGIIFNILKDHYEDFLHSTNKGQTWLETLRGLRFDTIVILGACLDKPIIQKL